MDPSSSSSKSKILKQREKLRVQISSEEDDPLAPYERYVNWLFEQEEQEGGVFDLEILVSLEEALRAFKDDRGYKDDLRYTKLWLSYAQRVEKADLIYVYMLKRGIGTIHAQLYDDYALSLEFQNRYVYPFSVPCSDCLMGRLQISRG
jgi:checkpoint serine/threonine-protein kinase